MCEDRVWVRQFQHQKALIWNISLFAFLPSPLHIFPGLQKPKLSLPHKQTQLPTCNQVQPCPAACSSTTNSKLLLPKAGTRRTNYVQSGQRAIVRRRKLLTSVLFASGMKQRCLPRVLLRARFWTQQSFAIRTNPARLPSENQGLPTTRIKKSTQKSRGLPRPTSRIWGGLGPDGNWLCLLRPEHVRELKISNC